MTDANLTVTPDRLSPRAFWLSFIPVFGGLAIIREGNRLSDPKFTQLGWGVFAFSIIMALADAIAFAWLLQIGIAIWFRSQYTRAMPAPTQPQLDFNSCSKHELVRTLDLPIVYANDIDLIREEGHIFTHAEELTELAGLPEEHVRRIAPYVTFSYDFNREGIASWRRVNFLSASELEAFGVEPDVVEKIVEERTQGGSYRSAIDIKKRTGLTLHQYKTLL
ncbi:MAG: helix-hairpin-helix domain-containing protein [Phormidesmis sp.]